MDNKCTMYKKDSEKNSFQKKDNTVSSSEIIHYHITKKEEQKATVAINVDSSTPNPKRLPVKEMMENLNRFTNDSTNNTTLNHQTQPSQTRSWLHSNYAASSPTSSSSSSSSYSSSSSSTSSSFPSSSSSSPSYSYYEELHNSPEQQIFVKYGDGRTDVLNYKSFIDLVNEMELCQNKRNKKKNSVNIPEKTAEESYNQLNRIFAELCKENEVLNSLKNAKEI